VNSKSEAIQGRSSDYYRLACAGLDDCVTLSECPQILVEATKKCYSGDRSIFCGLNANYEVSFFSKISWFIFRDSECESWGIFRDKYN
jgi:hypothetical protein